MISVGYELQNVLGAWEKALKAVPDGYLTRAYERAAENWPWTDGKAFGPDAVADAHKTLVVEDKQHAEADKRNAARLRPDTYKCHHCADVGYQLVFSYQHKLWYSSLRPCCCEATPANERQEFPLSEHEFVRNKVGEYARRCDIEKYGAPPRFFKEAVKS